MVHPYKKEELIKTDAFRGPLASAFKVKIDFGISSIFFVKSKRAFFISSDFPEFCKGRIIEIFDMNRLHEFLV